MSVNNFDCGVCGQSTKKEITKYNPSIWIEHSMFTGCEIECCTECGMGLISPAPNNDSLTTFYQEEYRHISSPFYLDFGRKYRSFYRDHRSISQLLLGLNYVDVKDGDGFLDIGPGPGASFREVVEIFGEKKMNLYAIELSNNASDYYNKFYGVKTFLNLDEVLDYTVKKPRLVLSSHSLEHFCLDEAKDFLRLLRSNVAEDGCCVFEVPHVDMRIHKDLRGGDDPHLMFFSRDALQKLFTNNGFEVLFIETCGRLYSQPRLSSQNISFSNNILKSIRQMIVKFAKAIPMLTTFFSGFARIRLKDDNFRYGGNRECLRLVVRPSHID